MRSKKLKITWLDAAILFVVVAAAFWFVYRIQNRIDYKWNWGVIPQYLVRFDEETGSWVTNMLLQGLFTTIRLSFWSTILATIMGLVMGLFRVSPSYFRRMVGRTYVELIRNLPPLVLVFIFYFFFSDQIMPLLGVDEFARALPPGLQKWLGYVLAPPERISAFLAAVITMALYEGAYITEIVRAGVESVEKGQWEASYALGMSRWQQLRHVILPQAVQQMIPPLAGQFISTIKDSAIVSVISIQELTFQGLAMTAATYLTFEVWTTVLAMYLLLTLTFSLAARKLELHLTRNRT